MTLLGFETVVSSFRALANMTESEPLQCFSWEGSGSVKPGHLGLGTMPEACDLCSLPSQALPEVPLLRLWSWPLR